MRQSEFRKSPRNVYYKPNKAFSEYAAILESLHSSVFNIYVLRTNKKSKKYFS